ncbi:MAG: VanZ family protein [Pyrinomonadaceae bacterium]
MFLWTGVIFFLSSNSGSMSETSRFVGPFVKFLFPEISEESLQTVHFLVRKSAHLTEYAMLAFFAVHGFTRSTHERVRKLRYHLPIVLVSIVAVADEIIQSFQVSRTASGWDSLLDLAGGAAMVTALWLIGRPRIDDHSPQA